MHVHAAAEADEVVITVADTGPGVPAKDRARIFEGFQQGGPAASAPGMGVGLTLARRFVELQGGRIDLESEAGQGSTFTITLPCPAAAGSGGSAEPAADAGADPAAPPAVQSAGPSGGAGTLAR